MNEMWANTLGSKPARRFGIRSAFGSSPGKKNLAMLSDAILLETFGGMPIFSG